MMRSPRLTGTLACLFAVLIWGTTFVTTKQLLDLFSPTQLLLLRLLVGYAALWVLAPAPLRWQGWRTEGALALSGALGITLYAYLENMALLHGNAGMVSVVVCTAPLLTALIARLLRLGGRLTPCYWLGFILAMIGVALTITQGNLHSLKGAWLGAGFALLAALAWATYTLLPRPQTSTVKALAVTRRIFLWGILLLLPFALPTLSHWKWEALYAWSNLWRLLFLGLLASALCYAAWNLAVARLGGVRSTLGLYLIPVVGVFSAALVLGEPLSQPVLLGVASTLAGVALSSLGSKP